MMTHTRAQSLSAGHAWHNLPRQAPAWLAGGMGALNLAWALTGRSGRWAAGPGAFSPFFDPTLGLWEALFSGLGLLFLAQALGRGKRYAWLALVALLAPLLPAYLSPPLDPARLGAAAGLLAWLLIFARRFDARSSPTAMAHGALLWAAGLAAALLAGFLQAPPGLPLPTRLAAALPWALDGFVLSPVLPGPGPDALPAGQVPALVFGVFAWSMLFWMLDRPLPPPPPPTLAQRERALSLVRQHGRSSQAHLTLLPDKRFFFSSGGSLVAFAVAGRSAAALADPIGPPADAFSAIREFCAYAARRDWLPAFCLTGSEHLAVYHRLGFHSLCLGYEAVIDLARFSLRGNASKTFRKRYNRLLGLGYRLEVYDPPLTADLLRELRQVSDEWLAAARTAEKGFFLAAFTEDYVRGERIALVRTPQGQVSAFVNLVPEYQLNELSIDLMRRRRAIEPGTMDFLFVALFLWAARRGYASFNMGLSPLYRVGVDPGSSLLERFIHILYEDSSFYDFKGLNGFKSKFRPEWTPQYLVFPSYTGFLVVGLALARLNAGPGESLLGYFRPPARITGD